SCFSLEYNSNVFGLYMYGKVNSFIYDAFALTIVASYSCNKCRLMGLARVLGRASAIELFGIKLKSIENVMKLNYGPRGTLFDTVTAFSKVNKCVVSVQCIIRQWL
ncbi:MAG: hypothetical protein ACKESA_01325, partial [Candidatus Hodgkinia cicadicola]